MTRNTVRDAIGSPDIVAQLSRTLRQEIGQKISNRTFRPKLPLDQVVWIRTRGGWRYRLLRTRARALLIGVVLCAIPLATLWMFEQKAAAVIAAVSVAIALGVMRRHALESCVLRPSTPEAGAFMSVFNEALSTAEHAAQLRTGGGRGVREALGLLRPDYEQLLVQLVAIEVEWTRCLKARLRDDAYLESLRQRRNEVGNLLIDAAADVLVATNVLEANRPDLALPVAGVPSTGVHPSWPALPPETRERVTAGRSLLARFTSAVMS